MADAFRYLYKSVLDSATMTASSEADGLPVENVQSPLIRKVYQSTTRASEWIKFDVGAATTINMVFVGNVNFTTGSIIRWQGNTSDSWGSPALDQAIVLATDALEATLPRTAHFFSSNQSYRWWRMTIKDTGNANNYLTIGRVMAGRYSQPAVDVSEGFTYRKVDPTTGRRTMGRQGYYNVRKRYDEYTYRAEFVDNVQADEILSLYQVAGEHTPVVVAFQPDTRPIHRTIYAQMEQRVSVQHAVNNQFNINEIVFSEKN